MQRYLRPSLLQNAGLQTFDDWASNFGEIVSKAELKPAGNGYRTKKRFAKFNNVPELMQMFKEFADIRTPDMLDLPVPKLEGGKPQTIVAHPNDEQKAYMKVLAERSEMIHSGAVDPSKDNMLKITGEARLLGLDARCVIPNAENYPDSKVNLCIDKIMEIYDRTSAPAQSVSFSQAQAKWELVQTFRQSWRLCTIWIYRGSPRTSSRGTVE